MSQIKTGTCTVTNGSATVTATGVTWVGSVLAGHAFNVTGEDAVYSVAANAAAPGGVQTLQLTAPYAGTSGAKSYQVTTSFSPISGLYEPDINDVDIAILLKHKLVRKLDAGATAAFDTITKTLSISAAIGATATATLTAQRPFTSSAVMIATVRMSCSTPTAQYNVEIFEGATLRYQYLNINQNAVDAEVCTLAFASASPGLTLKITNNAAVAATVTISIAGMQVAI